MTTPLFTVIVPTYGRADLLGEAVASVLAQTVDDFECLVVDDAGPEPAAVPRDPRVRLLRRTMNGGPGAARNVAIGEARGRYLCFLDDDDEYEAERLAIALEGLQRAPVTVCGEAGGGQAGRGGSPSFEGDIADTILDTTTPHLGRTAVRRDVVPSFDERFRCSEDTEWWLRLAGVAAVATVDRPGFRYRRHAGPRHAVGLADRALGNLLLLDVHAEYFATHPKAAAFRWKRVGLVAAQAGDLGLAREALLRSLRFSPQPTTAWHLARTALRPTTTTIQRTPMTPTGRS